MQLLAQLQAEVPDPLADDLLALLAPGRVTAPTGGILFLIFIGQGTFEGATMEVEGDHIGSCKSALRQVRQEEFVDETATARRSSSRY